MSGGPGGRRAALLVALALGAVIGCGARTETTTTGEPARRSGSAEPTEPAEPAGPSESAEPAEATVPAVEPGGAVLIEHLARGSPLATAGLAAGDRLLRWRRGEEGGELDSWDDLSRLEVEQLPRGSLTVEVARAGRRFDVELRDDRWRALSRPALGPEALEELRGARAALAAHDRAGARARWAALRERLDGATERAWVEMRLAAVPPAAGAGVEPGRPSNPWSEAFAAARATGDPDLEAYVASEGCAAAARAARFAEARQACARALELREGRGSPLAAVHVRYLQADLAGREGDPKEEERRYRGVLAELDALAPRSLFVVRALRGLAKSRANQDDLDGAFEAVGRALDLVERVGPRTLEHQSVLMTHGIFHWFRAEWGEAEARLGEALEILESIDPEHEEMANLLSNFGLVASERGDLARAEEVYLRSLELRTRNVPDPIQESRVYNNLATLAARRGDLATALAYDRRVLELRERLAPRSIDLAAPLLNLGEHSRRAGDFAGAVGFLARALEVHRRHAAGSRDEAATLVALGEARAALGEPEAEPTLVAALALAEQVAPGSATEAEALRALGERRAERGDLSAAEELLRRSAELHGLLTPGTVEEALALRDLGRVLRRVGRSEAALEALRAAAGALDRQFTTLGGTDEVRARFRESWRHVYDELSDLLREMGRPQEAFEVLEHARSRAFLFLLRAREIDVATGLPDDLAAERDAIAEAQAELERRLGEPGAARSRQALGELRARRRELQLRRDRLAERVGRWSPRLAGLEAALGVAEARAALGESVTAVSYAVDEHASRAWILGPGEQLEVVELGVGEAELRDLVDRFRLLLETPAPAADPGPLGERLHRLLIAPIAERVRTPALVVIPDGPLHHLPFPALVAAGDGREARRYLVEWKPLQFAGSLTSWAELRQRAGGSAGSMVAFADPDPTPAARPATPRAAWRKLPHGRREAERVADLFDGEAHAYVGGAATERAAKRLGGGARYLHFATHAFVDADSPLDSALVLAPSAPAAPTAASGSSSGRSDRREDGLLQAWEVLLELRLDAALVVLSGCETGGGALVADEGILGLTRAFQFAGARAVLASLWPVSDRATARLMERFYGELAAGRPADDALRRAQLALLGRADTAHPSYWAAFQLHGAAEGAVRADRGRSTP